jgi:hypothetical protein
MGYPIVIIVICYHKQMTVHFRRLRTCTKDCTVEDPPPYCTGPTDSAEPPRPQVAQAHIHRQGIPYETGDRLLARATG